MAEEGKKSRSTRDLVIRIVLFVVLIVIIIAALQLRAARKEYERGYKLYGEGKYEEAYEVFNAVQARAIAVIKVGKQARISMGRCKAEMATEIAFKDKSAEGYTKALKLLDEAKELAGSTEEIERRIEEYSGYLKGLEGAKTEPSQESPDAPAPPAGADKP